MTKKAVIRAYLERVRPQIFGPADAAALRRELRNISGSYLLKVLEESGATVAAELGGLPQELLMLLHFDTLSGAEQTLQELETRRRADAPMEELRRAGRRARQRASLAARNSRAANRLRHQWAEIASWFTVWLQTPEVFPGWLDLRKKSSEFKERFSL